MRRAGIVAASMGGRDRQHCTPHRGVQRAAQGASRCPASQPALHIRKQASHARAPPPWRRGCHPCRPAPSALTRPAQKMSRSAKYWVARSPMAYRDSTTRAPLSAHLASLS